MTRALVLLVDLTHRRRKAHDAGVVVAVAQTKCVSDLVDDLLTYPVEEGFLVVVHGSAVSGHTQAVGRDHTPFPVEVCETEDEVALAVEDIGVGQSEVLFAVPDAFGDAYDAFCVVLPARSVVSLIRHGGRRADHNLRVVPFAEDVARGTDYAVFEVTYGNEVDTHNKCLAAADNKACVDSVVGYVVEEYPAGASIVEVGVGRRDEAARRLVEEGYDLTATDLRDVRDEVADAVGFVRDDVRQPEASVYEGAELVYALRPPYEIHGAVADVARSVGADLLLAPLPDEGVAVEAELVNRGGRAFFVEGF